MRVPASATTCSVSRSEASSSRDTASAGLTTLALASKMMAPKNRSCPHLRKSDTMSTVLTRSSLRRPRSSLRRPRSTVLVTFVTVSALGLALFTSLISATSASAHAELVKITPELNAQLSTAPKDVVLEFNEPVSTSFATVVVTTAAGVSMTSGKPMVVGAKVTQALNPRLAAGAYRVAFRVVSADGHPVTGESGFTLRLASTTSPSMSAPSASSLATPSAAVAEVTPAQGPNAGQGGGLSWSTLAITGAVGLLIVGAGVLLWLRERP